MPQRFHVRAPRITPSLAAAVLLFVPACVTDTSLPGTLPPDLRVRGGDSFRFSSLDLSVEPPIGDPFPCDEGEAGCHHASYGPPRAQFPLSSDPQRDPLVKDSGVNRDANGWLKLDSTHTVFNYLWVANTHDLDDAGTVSRLDTKTVREVARYLTVTCSSLKTGSSAACDGENGCCAIDDAIRYAARKNKMPEPGHQAVQRTTNLPSRTSVDFNGDLFIANEAPGGQASVTKIANDPASCIDYNRNGRIDTSSDRNANGWIEVDCNGDGKPDDLASVVAKPCSNGLKQEFWGLDDECVLWTSNVFLGGARARALGLASGDTQVSDAWAGSHEHGAFVRLDGITGKQKADVALPAECAGGGNGPNGVAIDASGIAWVPQKGGGKLCYFDTKKQPNVGVVRDPEWGPMQADGITMDRDQNVWVGEAVARYTPDRTNGFMNLGMGWWMKIEGAHGTRITADSRNANAYFVYSCAGANVLQIPASTLKLMKMDRTVSSVGWPVIQMPCLGVAIDSDQNVWGLNPQTSTRALVDKMGKVTQPRVNGPAMAENKCPAGDSCASLGAEPYSDMVGIPLRGFTRPTGTYQVLVQGCTDASGGPADTEWQQIDWDSDVPPNTSLIVHAKSANSQNLSDSSWLGGQWTQDQTLSPFVLPGLLLPNVVDGVPQDAKDGWLLVEFIFKTSAQNASPKLKSFEIAWRCPQRL